MRIRFFLVPRHDKKSLKWTVFPKNLIMQKPKHYHVNPTFHKSRNWWEKLKTAISNKFAVNRCKCTARFRKKSSHQKSNCSELISSHQLNAPTFFFTSFFFKLTKWNMVQRISSHQKCFIYKITTLLPSIYHVYNGIKCTLKSRMLSTNVLARLLCFELSSDESSRKKADLQAG